MNKEEKLKLRELHSSANAEQKHILEEFYPDLKESEGERIRKALIDEIKTMNAHYSLFDGVPKERFIAWLEQQREQNLPSVNEHIWLYIVDDVLTWKNGIGQYLDNPEVQEIAKKLCSKYAQKLYNPSSLSNSNNKQEPVDKVEPKFKVGDWVVDNCGYTWKIEEILNQFYLLEGVEGGESRPTIEWVNKTFHLWTVKDAKDGDVLAFYSEYRGNKMVQVGIIEKYVGKHGGCSNAFKIHVGVNWENNLQIGEYMGCSDIRPATKEQCDLLFQKINESGYKWENNQLDQLEGTNDEGFVDLGLPSGTLWAKCNLGAKTETEFGYFFQWGETEKYKGLKQFNWTDYKFGSWNDLTKYNDADNKLVLDTEDDPVFVATCGNMRTPTKDQLQELIDHTNYEWTSIDGVNGMKFTNKKDNTKYIFIPAAGFSYGSNYFDGGSWGYVWSSSRHSRYFSTAWRMDFGSGSIGLDYNDRYYGYSVRGVR